MTNKTIKNNVIYPELSYEIVGICYEVHNELGRFRNEKQYCDAIEQKLKEKAKKYKREFILPPSFKGEGKKRNIVDFMIEDKLIIEAKTKRILEKQDYFQVQRYLVSSNTKLGLLVNFNSKVLTPKRVLNSNYL